MYITYAKYSSQIMVYLLSEVELPIHKAEYIAWFTHDGKMTFAEAGG